MAEEKERKKLVVWSGGLDSTTLLDDFARGSTKENPVLAYSFIVGFLAKEKLIKEKEVRKNYLQYAKKKGYFIDNRTIKVFSDVDVIHQGWPQQVFWISFVLPFIPDDCDVNFGFIQGDCVWLAINHFYTIFNEFKYIGDRENIELHFPFSFKTKCEVLRKYKEAKIPHNCSWTCENPKVRDSKIRACGRCKPCITLLMAKKELECRKARRISNK